MTEYVFARLEDVDASAAEAASAAAQAAQAAAEAAQAAAEAAVFDAEAAVTAAQAAQAAAELAETHAETAETNAETAETNAETAEANAEAAQAAAEAAVIAAEAVADRWQGTSTTSVAIATGSKAFTTQADKFFDIGHWLLVVSDANPANYMHGYVTAYTGTALTVEVTNIGGSGTHTDWTISLSGTRGAVGPTGPAGTLDFTVLTTDTPVVGDYLIFGDVSDSENPNKVTITNLLTAIDFQTATAAAAAYQPKDADLTAIAALATNAAGLSILTLTDPGADRIAFWDDSAGSYAHLQLNTGLSISSVTLSLDDDLIVIAGLAPSNDDIIQRKAGAWTNRTMAQLATDLDSAFLTPAEGNAAYQPLDELLTEIAALSTDPNADSGLFFDDSNSAIGYWTPTGALSFSGTTLVVAAASDTVSGVSELAIASELNTGTDAARAVTPDALAGSNYGKFVVSILVRDDSQDVNTGDGAGDVFWRVPAVINGWNLVDAQMCVQTAGTTNPTTVQIARIRAGTPADMLSTKITVDSTELDSKDAAASVVDGSNDDVQTGDRIRVDVDATSTTKAKGLLVELTFQAP